MPKEQSRVFNTRLLKTMNLYQGFNEENYSSFNQLQAYVKGFVYD